MDLGTRFKDWVRDMEKELCNVFDLSDPQDGRRHTGRAEGVKFVKKSQLGRVGSPHPVSTNR
eukprot:345720-Karenia_brevis.AAC.1